MSLAVIPALLVALTTVVVVAIATRKLRRGGRWSILVWSVLLVGGAVAAVVVRTVEALLLDTIVGASAVAASGARGSPVLQSLLAFGIVGPVTVLVLTSVVWPTVASAGASRDDVDPPLAAAVTASGFVVGRLAAQLLLDRAALGSGVRAGILAFDDVVLALTWGYGLAQSAGADGRLGGTPFGRYAIAAMLTRGAVELSLRSPGALAIPFAISVGVVLAIIATIGVLRLSRHDAEPRPSLASLGQETIREIARSELRRGRVRPLWILIGAIADLGGIVLGFAAAVAVGWSARIDFGEIDRAGPAAEYAALLLALGVIVSFPISAGIVGVASGGRDRGAQRAHVLEAGIAAILALGVLLFVLGVVAPVAVALGFACAPVAFVLAGLGAWIAVGRRV